MTNNPKIEDASRHDTCAMIQALLDIDARGALAPHGIGGLARDVLTKAKSTIARLEARIAELESGSSEPVLFVAKESIGDQQCVGMHATRKANDLQCVPLFTAPPASAAVLPDNLLSHRSAWLDAMDRLVELEPISHEPDSDDNGFWQHERKAMHDMYACLDATAALNNKPSTEVNP